MSMQVVCIKILPELHGRIAESEGKLLNALGDGAEEKGFGDENDGDWQMQGVAEFLSHGTQEDKGVIVGVA